MHPANPIYKRSTKRSTKVNTDPNARFGLSTGRRLQNVVVVLYPLGKLTQIIAQTLYYTGKLQGIQHVCLVVCSFGWLFGWLFGCLVGCRLDLDLDRSVLVGAWKLHWNMNAFMDIAVVMVASRISHLASRISHLASRPSCSYLVLSAPKVELKGGRGARAQALQHPN
jgi:hypothetical protein